MRYVLGVDGGQTCTTAVVADENLDALRTALAEFGLSLDGP